MCVSAAWLAWALMKEEATTAVWHVGNHCSAIGDLCHKAKVWLKLQWQMVYLQYSFNLFQLCWAMTCLLFTVPTLLRSLELGLFVEQN